jgi:hypothetical protein
LIFIFVFCRHELLSFWAFCYVPRSFSSNHLVAKVITSGVSRLAVYKQKYRNLTYCIRQSYTFHNYSILLVFNCSN